MAVLLLWAKQHRREDRPCLVSASRNAEGTTTTLFRRDDCNQNGTFRCGLLDWLSGRMRLSIRFKGPKS